MSGVAEKILEQSLLLDLETAPDGTVLKVGAVFGPQERMLKGKFRRSDVVAVLDELAHDAAYVLGHNIRDHDLPVLRGQFPKLRLHELPIIDTLFLSPVAFPANPYHRLVKDYRLQRTGLNNPVLDAKNAGRLFLDQCGVFSTLKEAADLLARFYARSFAETMSAFFQALEIVPFSAEEARSFFAEEAARYGCTTAARAVAETLGKEDRREASAYVLAWLQVAGANSILPPWVRHRFPSVIEMVRDIRELVCDDPGCAYCRENHHPQKQLRRFFGFPDFRPVPTAPDGGSLQEAIVRAGMNDEPLLAILPTGGGKSLCYQLPALVRNFRRGVLSIVISPLQALMKDQVDNLNEATESSFAAALYGMLTPPERGDVLERVRLGDVAVLYVSPEQLRNNSFRNVVREREIGCWIFDEAHCLSRWGHSFRPDYLYASRFIRELAERQHVPCPPVACFTATAKQDVTEEIRQHFAKELKQDLRLFDGGAERTNLEFEVQVVHAAEKRARVLELLKQRLPSATAGSSVVYCATRQGTEEMAKWLKQAGLSAEAFHAGLEAPQKRRIQEAFIAGEIQHICATNAFGMGIDKDNVRLVVHADIPGSLENYLQEAGRAGRDRKPAECVLLYDQDDVETQFALSAFSRLTRHDIAQILRGIRRARRDDSNTVVITAGEILRDELVETDFNTTDPMAATKVNTAISMLERGDFVRRDENRTSVLQVQPLVKSVEDAVRKIEALDLSQRTRRQWLDILGVIFNSNPNEGLSADELAELPSLAEPGNPDEPSRVLRHDTLPVIRILNDMVNAGIVKKDTLMSAYVKVRCVNAADKVFAGICELDKTMIAVMQEEEPDAEGWLHLNIRRLNQRLKDEGFSCTPGVVINLLKSLELDGRGLAGSRGSIDLKYLDKERYRVKLHRAWDELKNVAVKRRAVAGVVLHAIMDKIPKAQSGEHLVRFSETELLERLKNDMFVAAQIRDFGAAIERGLLFLHEQKVIILQQGLAVFRQAMSVTVLPESKGRSFTAGDYSALKEHYRERTFQIHVINRYAALGLEKITSALELVTAYFTLSKAEFVKRYFAGEKEMLERATSAESYQNIVDRLNNPVQVAVVAARPDDNLLVLAGPGSGKTRVIAHRCAYLLRVERVRPGEILVVCFNRAAALSLRRRIRDLAGKDAARVTVQTYHGLAMRLIGASLTGHLEKRDEPPDFDRMIREATQLLRGECDLPGLERDEMRERLLAGYRHILIDEYQDIDEPQYELISAIAGRTLDSENEEAKLSILAVGDDDQNVYSFRGANIRFIRQFETDYAARIHYLVENYRSTQWIIAAANRLIARNRDRMKTQHPIRINSARQAEPPGEPVRVVRCADALHQARYVLQAVSRRWNRGESMAVFARTRDELHAVRAALESAAIPSVLAAETRSNAPLHRMREAVRLIEQLQTSGQKTVTARRILSVFQSLEIYDAESPWCRTIEDVLHEWDEASGNHDRMPAEAVDFIYEALFEREREHLQGDGVYLSTVHAAKGLEFDHVVLLGDWRTPSSTEMEEERRLYYVGMTRAKQTLELCTLSGKKNPFAEQLAVEGLDQYTAPSLDEPPADALNIRYELLGLSDVWIGYPIYSLAVRRRVENLRPGEAVSLEQGDNRIFLCDASGRRVGALSSAASKAWNLRLPQIQSARIHSIITWKKEYLDEIPDRCPDTWEIPLIEIRSAIPEG